MEQTVYFGGPVLTMEPELYARAVLVEDGVIAAVGSRDEIFARKKEDARMVDLRGRALLPAFLDPHSHITALAATLGSVDLTGAGSFEEISLRIRRFLRETPPAPGQWVTCFGYDHNFLQEKRHPGRALLDAACPQYPLVAAHASGHMGVINTAALRERKLTAETPDPAGGVIGREPDGKPDGYLEETAFTGLSAGIPRASRDQLLRQLDGAQRIYLENGITTVQDGFTKAEDWKLLAAAAEQRRLRVDTVAYLDVADAAAGHAPDRDNGYGKNYRGRLKTGGYKMFLDGSPQGRTAWMSRPYRDAEDGYCGYPVHTDSEVERYTRLALSDGMQLLAHCNGDAAAEQWISACEKVLGEKGGEEIRPVMIHAQLVREDQLARMARIHMIASFFVAHTWYWGDVHLENFGPERANRISPVHTAIEKGVTYTFHQDTPVIRPNMLETIWCAVNRRSRQGKTLGRMERVTPLEALRAVTVNAARQYFEEDRKGSLRPGKLADFVILSQDPLTAEPEKLRDIRVCRTIKEDVVQYDGEQG